MGSVEVVDCHCHTENVGRLVLCTRDGTFGVDLWGIRASSEHLIRSSFPPALAFPIAIFVSVDQAMASDEAEAALCMGACKEAQTAYTVFVTVVGDFKANR